MLHRDFLHKLFRASGEEILGTLKYVQSVLRLIFFGASGEAILGTQRCLEQKVHFYDYNFSNSAFLRLIFFRASGHPPATHPADKQTNRRSTV